MFDRISAAFPKRPLRVKAHGVVHPFFAFLGCLMGFALIITVIVMSAPGIQRDWEIAKDPVEMENADIRNGKCTVRQAVMTDCKLTIRYRVAGKMKSEELNFLFVDFHSGNYTVTPIASRSNPDLVTVDLALDKLWNRIAMAGFLLLMGVAFVVLSLKGMARLMNLRRTFRSFSGKVLKPVPVEIAQMNKSYGTLTVTYHYMFRNKPRKIASNMRRQQPFLLSEDDTGSTALGVTDEHGSYVLLLDEALKRLDLSDTERDALRAARG